MLNEKEALRAAEYLRKWCKGQACGECIFHGGNCAVGYTTPENWVLPNPRRWSDAEIAMAKALKMYGYTTVECCRDGQFLSKNGKGLWLYLPPNFEFGVTRPGDSVSLDNIIREGEQK